MDLFSIDNNETSQITIYTDGGCHGNPGAGGWGAVLLDGVNEIELSGGENMTTNNRMELTAAIEVLRYAKEHYPSRKIQLFIDSQYVKNGITAWIKNWKTKGWKTADKKAVKNQDLWVALDKLNEESEVEWTWVKGHAGIKYNEVCDSLCQMEIAKRSN